MKQAFFTKQLLKLNFLNIITQPQEKTAKYRCVATGVYIEAIFNIVKILRKTFERAVTPLLRILRDSEQILHANSPISCFN